MPTLEEYEKLVSELSKKLGEPLPDDLPEKFSLLPLVMGMMTAAGGKFKTYDVCVELLMRDYAKRELKERGEQKRETDS